MKNKLFVRGAVIVVALMLLVSTVAFADATATPELNADNTAIVFADATGAGYTSSEDQVTILAFAVDKGTEASAVAALADGTGVVAINQVAGSVGFTTVPINSAVFDEGGVAYGKDIAVLVGGTDTETPAAYVLSTDAEVVEPTTYTASFAGDGVSIEAMTGNAEGATITLPAVPAKEGYTGVWNDGTTDYEGGATYTFGAADVTFTAVYTAVPATYTASFAGDGVSIDAMTGNAEGATITLPAVPAKDGYTGVWNDGTTDYEGGATYTFGAADVTFTAVYTAVPVVDTDDILTGDLNLDGKVNSTDTNTLKLWTDIPALGTTVNNNKRAALKEEYPAFKFAESYDLADGSGTILIGDINLDGKVNSTDTNTLKLWTDIPALGTTVNNNKRAALKEEYPVFKFAETYTVVAK